ncbi:hypothetical protein G6F31_019187 [Rhizopus arrhizus]|nr:hypothetical protein G6F31_019187 [Rhizopus arrhizus]
MPIVVGVRRRDDCAAEHLAYRRPDRHLLPPGGRGHWRRRAVRAAGLPADVFGADGAVGHPAHRDGPGVVRDAQARRLARSGKDLGAAPLRGRRRDAPHLDPVRQQRPVPGLRNGARRRRRQHRLLLSRHAVRLRQMGGRGQTRGRA